MPYKDPDKQRAYQNAWLKERKKTWTESQWEARRTTNRAFFHRSKAKGLCGCGREKRVEFCKCDACRELDNVFHRTLRARRIEAHVCADCGLSLDLPGSSLRSCMNCNEKQANRAYFRRGR